MTALPTWLHRRRGPLIAALYVVAGFAVVFVLVVATGGDLGAALGGWFTGAFGDGYNLTQTLSNATPLALVAIGVSVALRAGVVTVGAEGQLIVGAILSTVVALLLGPDASPAVALPLGAVAGVIGGMLWALPAAVAKIRWNVNEILFTLLANYLAVSLLTYLLRTVLRDPETNASPQSPPLPLPSQLPQLPVSGRIHVGIVIVALILLGAWWWSRTRQAFVLEVYGSRPVLAARLGLTPRVSRGGCRGPASRSGSNPPCRAASASPGSPSPCSAAATRSGSPWPRSSTPRWAPEPRACRSPRGRPRPRSAPSRRASCC